MDSEILTPRWTVLRPHSKQLEWMASKARFNIVPAGRRSGKTERAKRKLVRIALSGSSPFPDPRYFAAAPTRQQAKDIWWVALKQLSPREFVTDISESELRIKYITGGSITVVGMDKPQRIEGQPWDGGVLDEYGNMKSGAWPENIRPALSDRFGWCDLIGVPEGRNHYYDLYDKTIRHEVGFENWAVFHWKSIDILDAQEIRDAKATMDPLTFEQEYEGSFLNFQGRVYYCFERSDNCSINVKYNPHLPLIFCFDFNVAPGVAAILQEQPMLPCGNPGTAVIGEVHIPRNSNTVAVCNRLIADWGKHKNGIHCYGDSTGGNPGSAKLAGSDWDIIRRELRPAFGEQLKILVPPGNPRERARVNAVNSRLRSGKGEDESIRFMVHPKCKNVIKDFEGVRCLEGGTGEIDKDADLELSHISDAIGYYVNYKFPVAKGSPQKEF